MSTTKTKKLTHRQQILEYLLEGGRLSHADAYAFWRCTRLAARIEELRRDGYPIKSVWRNVDGVRFVSYRIV